MHVLTLELELHLPGCASLKEKRGRLKPLINQLQKRYKVSAAEVDLNDLHQSATVACALVSNNQRHAQQVLARAAAWIEHAHPDLQLVDHQITNW